MIFGIVIWLVAFFKIASQKINWVAFLGFLIAAAKFLYLAAYGPFETDAELRTIQAFSELPRINLLNTFTVPALVNYIPLSFGGGLNSQVALNIALYYASGLLLLKFKGGSPAALIIFVIPSGNYYSLTGLRDTLIFVFLIAWLRCILDKKYKLSVIFLLFVALMRPEFVIVLVATAAVAFALSVRMKSLHQRFIYLWLIPIVLFPIIYLSFKLVMGFLTSADHASVFETFQRVWELRYERQFLSDDPSYIISPDEKNGFGFIIILILQFLRSIFFFHGSLSQSIVSFADSFIFSALLIASIIKANRYLLLWSGLSFMAVTFMMVNYGNLFRMRYLFFPVFIFILLLRKNRG